MGSVYKTIILLIISLFLMSFFSLEKELENTTVVKQDKLDLIINELKEIKELLK